MLPTIQLQVSQHSQNANYSTLSAQYFSPDIAGRGAKRNLIARPVQRPVQPWWW